MSVRRRPGDDRREWLGKGVPEYVSYELDLQGLDDEALGFLQAEEVQVVLRLHDGRNTAILGFPASTSQDIGLTLDSIGVIQDVLKDLYRDLHDRWTALRKGK
jgi:hypothetical protein